MAPIPLQVVSFRGQIRLGPHPDWSPFNLLLTERGGCTGEYWPGVVARSAHKGPRVNIPHYYMARQIRAFWLVLFWSGFRHTDRFRGNGHKLQNFLFSKDGKFNKNMARVPYNKLLTNLASSSRTEEYWASVVFVRTSLRSVRTATTSGQYSPVRPSRSVSKRLVRLELARLVSSLLYGTRAMLFWICRLSKTKTTKLMTVSTETVHMAK